MSQLSHHKGNACEDNLQRDIYGLHSPLWELWKAKPSPCPSVTRRGFSGGGSSSSLILSSHLSLSGGLTQIKESAEIKLNGRHSSRAKKNGNVLKPKAYLLTQLSLEVISLLARNISYMMFWDTLCINHMLFHSYFLMETWFYSTTHM